MLLGTLTTVAALACVGLRIWSGGFACADAAPAFINVSEAQSSEPEEDQTQAQTEKAGAEPEQTDSARSEEQTEAVNEALYPVIETHIGEGALVYSNFSVKNTTDYVIDFEDLISRELPFSINDTHEVQVLIVHTHACESYLTEDTGYYSEDYYPRSGDNSKNVTQVGKSIMSSLKEEGIGVVQCLTQHDNPSYDGSYDRSRQSIEEYLEKYPNIKVILDIHRDSLGSGGESGKIKPTFTYGGKKAAQIMIMTGYDGDGSFDYPDWEQNLVFALKLQQTAEDMFPGMTRPLYFGNFVYNLNVNSGSLLIEIGTDANTLDEAVYTGELLGKALAKVLQSNE